MKIVKHIESNFTILSNKLLFNRTLSMKEKGILAVMFGLPDDWKFSIRGLATLNEDGVEATASALKSLEKKGFLKRERTFYKNGQFCGIDYHIYEESQNVDTSSSGPRTGNHDTENCQLLNTNISSTNKLNTNIRKESRPLKKCYDNFKSKIEEFRKKARSQKQQRIEENEQLKEEYQVSNETKTDQDFESIDEPIQQLKEEYQVSDETKADQDFEHDDNTGIESEYSDIFDFELKNKYSDCKMYVEVQKNTTQQDNYTEPSKNNSMSTYGRESFDDITCRKISYTEERVKLGKYLAFIICRFGKITNDVWEAFLDRYLSLGNTVKERLANLAYSLAGGYRNIFKASKNENTQTQYSAISIFD